MPRGFGKTRLELTVKETWRERAAATCGVDQNIEVTKIAAKVLETFADTGSYWSVEEFAALSLLESNLVKVDGSVRRFIAEEEERKEKMIKWLYQLMDLVDHWRNTATDLSAVLTAQNLENQRLRALLEEHCKGCPASELK